MPDYDGMLGQDIYENMPETTDKIIFEGAGEGHGFAALPYGEIQNYALNWLKYQVLGEQIACENLLEIPSVSSLYLTNIECPSSVLGDINEDNLINVLDILLIVNIILNFEYNYLADLNSDNLINVLDIVEIVNIIIE